MHWRVMGREAVAVGVGVQIAQTEGFGVCDDHAEHPATGGARTDLTLLFLAQSDRQEFVECRSALIEDPKGAVPSVDQRTGLGNEVLEEFGQLDVGRDHEDCGHEPL